MPDPSERRRRLESALREAAQVARTAREQLDAKLKNDGSIVTNVDVDVEIYLRKVLPQIVPETNVWGEELGYEEEGPGGVWLVDPIDGTSNFRFGSPLWGISVALMKDGVFTLAAILLPDLNELYSAELGAGATINGVELAPIPPGPVRPEQLISIADTAKSSVVTFPGKQRIAGAAVVDGAFVANQRYRGWIGGGERLYDVAAAMLICQELGAEVRLANGQPFRNLDYLNDRPLMPPWLIFPPDSGYVAR